MKFRDRADGRVSTAVGTASLLDRLIPPFLRNRTAGGKAAAIIVCLVVVRAVAATFTPLFKDEAYYWALSKHLAAGYYDHPPMVAFVIRIGTALAGDTQFGIRIFSILLAFPMSWAVYRSTEILFEDSVTASTAAILLNATMMVSIGTVIVTPDVPLMVASSFVLLYLAKVCETGVGAWWLAVGAAVGVALVSKYTAFFFGPIIILWLMLSPRLRHWLISPWPYAGALLAFAIFLPVVAWNANYHWVSFIKQFGRLESKEFNPVVAGYVGGQFALATPAVFILAASGLYVLQKAANARREASSLICLTIGVLFLFFLLQSLHGRHIPLHWLGAAYPAVAVAAAVAAHYHGWGARWGRLMDWSARWSIPSSLVIFALIMTQVQTGILTGFRRDPTAVQLAVGVDAVAEQVDKLRNSNGAKCILTNSYETQAWLEFFLPPGSCVTQRGERYRWVNAPEPDSTLLSGPLIYVTKDDNEAEKLNQDFRLVRQLAKIPRKRGPLIIAQYIVYLLDGPKGTVLDYRGPPELQN